MNWSQTTLKRTTVAYCKKSFLQSRDFDNEEFAEKDYGNEKVLTRKISLKGGYS